MTAAKRRRSSRSDVGAPAGIDLPTVDLDTTPLADGAAPPSEDTPAAKVAAKRYNARTRRAELNRELVVELRALRAALREMMERYELRVGGHLADLIQRVEGDPAIGATARPIPTKLAKAMLEDVRQARLRPRKGRAKDFTRLGALVDDLTALAPDR